jgi:hypothetical protein
MINRKASYFLAISQVNIGILYPAQLPEAKLLRAWLWEETSLNYKQIKAI